MRLESLNCPNCDAPLKFEPGQTLCICLYCNSTIRIHDDAPQPQATAVTSVSEADVAGIRELLLAGQAETAIQQYQQVADCSPEEARTAITNLGNEISFSTLRQQQLSRSGFVFFFIVLAALAWALFAGLSELIHPILAVAVALMSLFYIALFGKGFLVSLKYLRAEKGVATVQQFTRINSHSSRQNFYIFRLFVEVQPESGASFKTEMLLPVRETSLDKLHQGTRFGVKFLPGDETSAIFDKLPAD